MQSTVKKWLEQGRVDAFIAYKKVFDHALPHVFTRDDLEECRELVCGEDRYPLEKLAAQMASEHPDLKIGMLALDCNQRALNVLSVWHQIDLERIETLPLSCCPSRLKGHRKCSYLSPPETGQEKKELGLDPLLSPESLDTMSQEDLFRRWNYEFSKCIKCYGCRNACPVCFCSECSLEHETLVHTAQRLTEVPLFHLIRAVHMAGRCIDCGLCEEACPMDIPLRLLYSKVNSIVLDRFDYQTGSSTESPPLNAIGQDLDLELQSL